MIHMQSDFRFGVDTSAVSVEQVAASAVAS